MLCECRLHLNIQYIRRSITNDTKGEKRSLTSILQALHCRCEKMGRYRSVIFKYAKLLNQLVHR